MKIYVLIDDKGKTQGARHFTKYDKDFFTKENEKGFGVYATVNSFSGDRKEENAIELQYAYADMDIAKKGDGQSREEKEKKKEILKKALLEYCEPTMIIDTSNGIQPLWKIENFPVNKEVICAYKNILKGIRIWGKSFGSAGDNVYDVSRIIRLPNFYHQKEEPFLCTISHKSDREYTYDELTSKFPYIEQKPQYEPRNIDFSKLGDIDREIEMLDIKDVAGRAFQSIGRTAEWDRQNRLILDGRLTGTFQGKNDDRQYLASTSHEPFQGNKITVVADIRGITNKEARQWIIEEFSLKQYVQTKKIEKIKDPEPIDNEKRFTWGTKNLNYSFAIIHETDFIVIGAKRSSGKTVYSMDMAVKNALIGHRVLYISLEMDTDMILDDIGRKYSGITIEEQFDKKIPQIKKDAYNRKIKEIKSIDTLILQGIRRNEGIDWNTVKGVIQAHKKIDMVFIDNLDLICGEAKENNNDRQARITREMMSFSTESRTPIVLIHHYRKSGKDDYGMDELAGSGKIADNADRVVRLKRENKPDSVYPEKYKTQIALLKGRGYPESYQEIYFIKGTFVDNAPFVDESQMIEQGLKEDDAVKIFDESLISINI
jgi:hypothetical protein